METSKKSFSKQVKDELVSLVPSARHCRMSELEAINMFSAPNYDNYYYKKKCFTLADKTINITEYTKPTNDELIGQKLDKLLIHECCKKAFLRGAFLVAGSVTDPLKSYHLEIVSDNCVLVEKTYDIIRSFGLYAGQTKRKTNYVIYIKEGVMLVEFLGLIGAPLSLMELENIRIIKDMRNDVNRIVNCEAANIKKTIDAAITQIEDIKKIERLCGLEKLPKGLREVARIRVQYPEATYAELGEHLNPPVGKSGVNHRLRRISQIASNLMREGVIDEKRDCN